LWRRINIVANDIYPPPQKSADQAEIVVFEPEIVDF
jgi:hypothetical protein